MLQILRGILDGDTIQLRGLVGEPDGSLIIESTASGHREQAGQTGIELADDLLARGAKTILDKLYQADDSIAST